MTSAASPSTSVPQLYPDYCHVLSPTIGKWCPLRAVDVLALRDVGMFCDGIRVFHHGNHPVKWVRLTGVIVAIDEYPGREDRETCGTGPGKMVYMLDDSSGVCIECTATTPAKLPKKETELSLVPRHLDQLGQLQARLEEKRKRQKAVAMNLAGYAKDDGGKKEDKKEEQKIAPSVLTPAIPWDEVDVGSVVKVKGRVGIFRDEKKVEIVKIEVLRSTDMEVRCWNEVKEFREGVLEKPWLVSKEEEKSCKRKRERDLKRMRRGNTGIEKQGRTEHRKHERRENDGKGKERPRREKEKVEDQKKGYDARDLVLRERRHRTNTSLAATKIGAG